MEISDVEKTFSAPEARSNLRALQSCRIEFCDECRQPGQIFRPCDMLGIEPWNRKKVTSHLQQLFEYVAVN